jgi:hypothetical protein
MMIHAHRLPPELLLQLGLPDNLVIGLVIAPDLILRLTVAGGNQGNDLVTAEPDPGRRRAFGVADVLADGVAMRSHDRIVSSNPGEVGPAHLSPGPAAHDDEQD